MRHALAGLRAVPVLGVRRDERDDAGLEIALVTLGRDDPVAFGHQEDLVRRVNVPAVPRAVLEMDFGKTQVFAVLAADRRDGLHVTGEDLGDAPRALLLVELDDPHGPMVARLVQT